MCITEFDYLLERVGVVAWEPAIGPCAGCDRTPAAGEQVEQWAEIPHSRDEWDQDTNQTPVQVLCCQHCTQACRLLAWWCGGEFSVDFIADQLNDHRNEDSSYRSGPFRHLVGQAPTAVAATGAANHGTPAVTRIEWIETPDSVPRRQP
jgi:hypothetical protein